MKTRLYILLLIFYLYRCQPAQKEVFRRRTVEERVKSDITWQSEKVIVSALQDMLHEIKKIKPAYSQLSDIENAQKIS